MTGPTPPLWVPTVVVAPRSPIIDTRRLIWLGGVVVVVIGTFLPWLRSGRIQRNSYELAGVGVRRLQAADWVEVVLRGWPFLGVLWAVAVALLILGRIRAAGALSAVLGVSTGLIALGGLYLAVRLDSSMVGGTLVGPLVTLTGAVTVTAAGVSLIRRP